MENNTAIVCKIGQFEDIEGKDNIVVAKVLLKGVPLTQVVTSKNTKESSLIVYFDSNLCIPQKIIDAIDNIDRSISPNNFVSMGKYLANGNRVRCVKLGGVISNGLCIPIEKFQQFFNSPKEASDTLVDGYSFTAIKEKAICEKWFSSTIKKQSNSIKEKKDNTKFNIVIPSQFNFHIDTAQLPRNIHNVHPDSVISISRKVHGTSAITSYSKTKEPLISWIDRLKKFFKVYAPKTTWSYLYASRSVIKNANVYLNKEFNNFDDLWVKVGTESFNGKLHKGETVYYEIVGYNPGTGAFIQKNYDYGCAKGEYKIAVYRITSTNENGVVFEYSVAAMRERCKEINVPMVEEFYYGKASDLFKDIIIDDNWGHNFLKALKISYLEKDCLDNKCKKMPDEGIVIRVEGLKIESYKYKSDKFTLKESEAKESSDNIDTEDQESNA
jgi:hypothetical protein